MPAFDIDDDQGEVDDVYFNGHKVGTLKGANDAWQENEFNVPIEWVKFPTAPGSAVGTGQMQPPVAAENEIQIDIDVRDAGWCASIDWAELRLKAMAPLLLIHGTGANPEAAWEVEPGVTEHLTRRGIPFEHRIQLTPNGSIAPDGRQLQSIVHTQAKKFGVKQVHLVAHSKGGLDSRSYLSNHYYPNIVKVLSLHTLSTPHHGSILADISVAQRDPDGGTPVSQDDQIDAFIVSDHYLHAGQGLLGIGADRPALDNLRVAEVADFNSKNTFPSKVKLYTYSANADLDGDREIFAHETRPLIRQDIPAPIAAHIGNLSYNILGRVATIRVTKVDQLFGLVQYKTVEPEITYPDTNFQVNDLLVTDTSSQHPSQLQHSPPFARNHRNMKDEQTMNRVLEKIRQDFPMN